MNKTCAFLIFLLLASTCAFADDTVKVMVGTQTYFCEIAGQLNCKAVNQLQKQEMLLKRNAGQISIQDKERNLTADISTTLDNNNIIYDLTLCSAQACTISTAASNAAGDVNQIMVGQYNITQKSFYVLGFFINNHSSNVNIEESLLSKVSNLGFHSR